MSEFKSAFTFVSDTRCAFVKMPRMTHSLIASNFNVSIQCMWPKMKKSRLLVSILLLMDESSDRMNLQDEQDEIQKQSQFQLKTSMHFGCGNY